MVAALVIWPKLDGGAAPEPLHDAFGAPNSTWLTALNISIRNWSACFSTMRKSLVTEKSKFTRFGPRRLLRPQFPNVPAKRICECSGVEPRVLIRIVEYLVYASHAIQAIAVRREGHARRIPSRSRIDHRATLQWCDGAKLPSAHDLI